GGKIRYDLGPSCALWYRQQNAGGLDCFLGLVSDNMTLQSQTYVRHSIRPLNVFSFCGQPIPAPHGQYHLATKDLPPCPECKRARDKAALTLGGGSRKRAQGAQNSLEGLAAAVR